MAALEQHLETDRKAARIELDRYFRGVLVQAKSPGFDQFVEGRNHEEAYQGFQQIAAVFGEEQVNVETQYRRNHPVHEKRGYHGLNRLSLPGETHANPEAIICPTTPHLPLGVADVSKLWRPAGRLQLSGLG